MGRMLSRVNAAPRARPARDPRVGEDAQPAGTGPPRSAHALLIAGAALLPFDDLGTSSAGGSLTSAPAWIPFALLAVVLTHWRAKHAGSPRPRVLILLMAMLGYGLVLTLGTLQFLPAEALGEDLALKGVKVGGTILAWILCVLAGWLAWRHLLPTLRVALLVALVITAAFAILATVGGPLDAPGLLHEGVNFQQRVRGSRFEASSLGACLLILGGYLALTLSRRPAIASQAVLLPATFLLTSSRGSLVAAGLIAVATCVALVRQPDQQERVHDHRVAGWAGIAAGLGGTFGLGWVVRSDTWRSLGLGGGGSDATRSLWGDVAISTTLDHPLGVGFSGLPWIRDALSTLR